MKIKFTLKISIEAETELQALENLVDLIKADAYRTDKSVVDVHLENIERINIPKLEIPRIGNSPFEERIKSINSESESELWSKLTN